MNVKPSGYFLAPYAGGKEQGYLFPRRLRQMASRHRENATPRPEVKIEATVTSMSNYKPFLRSLSANTLISTFDRYLTGYYYSFLDCAKKLHLYYKA